MKKAKRVISFILIMTLVIGCTYIGNIQKVSAKTKKGYYSTTFENGWDVYQSGTMRKIKFKSNKMIVWGSFNRSKTKKGMYGNTKYLGYMKRTFKLSKKLKCYFIVMGKEKRESKKSFFKTCKEYCKSSNGVSLWFRVKKGKVVKMVISS